MTMYIDSPIGDTGYTQKQERLFIEAYLQALLWSSTDTDYSEPPEDYRILGGEGMGYNWFKDDEEPENWADIAEYDSESECILGAWHDSGEEPPMLEGLEYETLSQESKNRLTSEALEFLYDIKNYLDIVLKEYSHYSIEQAGHDFALTRNGHGAGFWDRGIDKYGDTLTYISENYGEVDLYIGDDGYVYY